MTKAIVLTHNDLDGVSCGILFQLYAAQQTDFEVQVTHCAYPDLMGELKKAAKQFKEDDETKFLFITDCMFTEDSGGVDIMEDLFTNYQDKVVRVIDHHSTALWANKYGWAMVRQSDDDGVLHCATYWVGEYLKSIRPWSDHLPVSAAYKSANAYQEQFVGNPKVNLRVTKPCFLDEYILMVDLWDTWRWKNYPDIFGTDFDLAKDLNSLLHVKGTQRFVKDALKRLSDAMVSVAPHTYVADSSTEYLQRFFSSEDALIIDLNNEKIKRLINTASTNLKTGTYAYKIVTKEQLNFCWSWFKNKFGEDSEKYKWAKKHFYLGYACTFTIGIIFGTEEISSVCHGVLAEHPELDFVINVTMPTSLSFRSDKDLEVPLGIIANHVSGGGGGGHEKASGCSIAAGTTVVLIKELLGNIKLHKIKI